MKKQTGILLALAVTLLSILPGAPAKAVEVPTYEGVNGYGVTSTTVVSVERFIFPNSSEDSGFSVTVVPMNANLVTSDGPAPLDAQKIVLNFKWTNSSTKSLAAINNCIQMAQLALSNNDKYSLVVSTNNDGVRSKAGAVYQHSNGDPIAVLYAGSYNFSILGSEFGISLGSAVHCKLQLKTAQ